MLTYMIIVNDAGELKTVSPSEVEKAVEDHFTDSITGLVRAEAVLDEILDRILDDRATEEEIASAAGAS